MNDLLKFAKKEAADWAYFDKFASLLAEKHMNIVRSSQCNTASISLETNTITIPFFSIKDKDTFLVMLSHEVSHALHTPKDWYANVHMGETENTIDNDRASVRLKRIILNIVEDIRIERLIRRKFPGFVSVYNRGYSKLLGLDFFSLNQWDDFKLHDRINAYAKLGNMLPHTLSDFEMEVFKNVSDTETFEDVIEKANYLYELVKVEMVKPNKPKSSEFNSNADSGGCEQDVNDTPPHDNNESEAELQDLPEEIEELLEDLFDTDEYQHEVEPTDNISKDEPNESTEEQESNKNPEEKQETVSDEEFDDMNFDDTDIDSMIDEKLDDEFDKSVKSNIYGREFLGSKTRTASTNVWGI